MPQPFYFPSYQALSGSGVPLPGAKLNFFLTGTATAAAVYSDAARTTALANPVVADAQGRFPQIYPNPNLIYRVQLTDSGNVQQWLQDGVTLQLFPRTDAEISAGITPASYATAAADINVLRYGIVPNNVSAATANTTALKALLDPTKTGPVGRLIFPAVTGADTYYLNDIIQVRDGIHMDLCQSTLNFAKSYAASDNFMGFLTFIRDVTIENGRIVVNYNGTAGAGSNPGPIMRIGSRTGYKFGTYTAGIFDKDDLADHGLPAMGNITLRNLRLTTNNPNAAVGVAVLALGGLQNVVLENIVYEGPGANAGPECFFYYEFGMASQNGFPSVPQRWSSSHAHGLQFRNVIGRNLNTTAASGDGYVIALVEAYSAVIEGIHGDGCAGVFESRIGEAHFYRPWTADAAGAKRCITMRNITGQNITSVGILLNGAMGTTGGYLNDASMIAAGLPVLTPSQKVDLMTFSLDGFALSGGGAGIKVSGPCTLRNGVARNCFNNFFIDGDCVRFEPLNVESLDATGVGIRASDPSTLFPRKKIGAIRCSKVAGSVGAGIALDLCESLIVEDCQLGYNAVYDPANETTQTAGITVSVDGNGVLCRGNFVTTSGGALAYVMTGSGDRGCNIESGRGTRTYTAGMWQIDGVAQAHSGRIADKTDSINTINKYFGKHLWDTSNNRELVALGSVNIDGWRVIDGSATVTPA